MKKIFVILLAALLMMTVFAGCSSLGETAQTGNSNVPSSGMQEHEPLNSIVLTDEIIKLTDGFSAVRYSGDYGFDLFLDQGGASLFGRNFDWNTCNGDTKSAGEWLQPICCFLKCTPGKTKTVCRRRCREVKHKESPLQGQ